MPKNYLLPSCIQRLCQKKTNESFAYHHWVEKNNWTRLFRRTSSITYWRKCNFWFYFLKINYFRSFPSFNPFLCWMKKKNVYNPRLATVLCNYKNFNLVFTNQNLTILMILTKLCFQLIDWRYKYVGFRQTDNSFQQCELAISYNNESDFDLVDHCVSSIRYYHC